MGCFAALLVLAAPRFVMVVLWLLTDYLSRAYGGFLLPLVGFFLLPTTTLAYAIAQNQTGGVRGWSLVVVIIAAALDVGIWGQGRGVFARRSGS
ncbi:MAG TPA: hypothetical protein VNP73_01565 [Actinomycetota bacterium]|nr:hypothetical protein [Actinomycetota bacterium]